MSDFKQVFDFLNSIEGAGYGGMAEFEIARETMRRASAVAMTEGCIICANGNDLPEGEYCRACGREGSATGLRAAVIKARGRPEPPSSPVKFAQPPAFETEEEASYHAADPDGWKYSRMRP